MLLALVGVILGCEAGSIVRMPNELVGSWRTSADLYQDRYLMLTPLEVRFGMDGDTSTTHQVSEVREMVTDDAKVYRITYLSGDEQEYWLSVEYRAENQTLRLVNQPEMVWERSLAFDS